MTVPAHDAALEALREAVAGLPGSEAPDDAPDDAPFDAAEHAAAFESVHDALVAVLADVDRT
jgi:hypothetical protein